LPKDIHLKVHFEEFMERQNLHENMRKMKLDSMRKELDAKKYTIGTPKINERSKRIAAKLGNFEERLKNIKRKFSRNQDEIELKAKGDMTSRDCLDISELTKRSYHTTARFKLYKVESTNNLNTLLKRIDSERKLTEREKVERKTLITTYKGKHLSGVKSSSNLKQIKK